MTQGLLKQSQFEPEKLRPPKRPRVQVQAAPDDAQVSDWGSLLGDLARPSTHAAENEVEWRVHDKTHLEFAIDYPFEEGEVGYTWEAFFFVPESFRLDGTTYDKKEMYEDLLSYVRLAVPELPFASLAPRHADAERDAKDRSIIADLEDTILQADGAADGSPVSRLAIRRARTFACLVRASGVAAQRRIFAMINAGAEPSEAGHLVVGFARTASRVAHAFRAVLASAEGKRLPTELSVALKWIDEDISLVIEALTANASVRIQERSAGNAAWCEMASRLAAEAVAEARYRETKQYPSVGTGEASPREMEHIEFRRHMLKRFTSSVLWLKHEVRDGTSWIVHWLYAIAAAIAMSFAFIATGRASGVQKYFYIYVFLIIISYAAKDRMKAFLQAWFSKWADRRFSNRRWRIQDPERETMVGTVRERAGFRPFAHLPKRVLEARRLTREHALEEFARPERVLWHEKRLVLEKTEQGRLASPMLTEIFRLNIGPWLQHTDDPNRTITFADPKEATVYTATARRVYNIAVVYRLRRDDAESPWRRIRVVVSRKGIERIDPIV
jgi:hypothetical protein